MRHFGFGLVVIIHDLVDVGVGFTPPAIAVFDHRVVVVLRIGFHQYGLGDVAVPLCRVLAVFLGEGYRVKYVGRTGIVGGKDEFVAFRRVRHS